MMPLARTSRRTGPRPFTSAMALAALLLIAPATARAAADCTSPVFSLPQQYGVGAGPTSVVSGDFNGDGIKDLAVPNNVSHNVSVLLGDGAGGFGPPTNFAVPQSPGSIAVGDFNKDGKADLAVGHGPGGGGLVALFGDGAGRFSTPLVINTSGAPSSLAVGDFNGDTNPDLAAGVGQGSPRVLLGDGAGNFTLRQFSIGSDSRFVAVGNFNGDNIEDLAFSVDATTDEVVIVLGNASGNFTAGARMTLDQSPKAMLAHDFNGDGREDLAVIVEHSEPRLQIFINDGAGNFGASSLAQIATGSVGLAAADFNKDGKADLAVGNGSAQILFGNGAGFFSTNSERYLTGGARLLAGDFNDDGNADLVSPLPDVGIIPGVVLVVPGRGDGTFDVSRSRNVGGFNTSPSALAVADFNGDGRSDVASTFFPSSINLILGDGAGGLGQTAFGSVPAGHGVWVATGDFDGDGKADAASANGGVGTGTVTVFYGDGGGAVARSINVSAHATFVAAANFNGDARSDLVALTDNGRVTILLSTGPSSFAVAPGSPFDFVTGGTFPTTSAAVGDFNGDGRDDLAITTSSQNTVSVFLNDGAGRMTLSSTAIIPIGSALRDKRLAVGDFNRDGRADVVSSNGQARNVTVFLGDGAGGLGAGTNFASTTRNFTSISAVFMAVADFDGDTNPDLAVSNRDFTFGGDLSVLFGDGAGGFGAPFTQTIGANPWVLAAGHFNADSKPDLAILGLASNSITVLQNVYEPLPCLSVGDVTLDEGDAGSQVAAFNVTLSQASTQTVRVNYSLKGVSATEGADYAVTFGRLVFAPGETSKTVTVNVAGDALDEADETFEFNLASPSGAGVADGVGLGTVTDNDPTPTLSADDITVVEGEGSVFAVGTTATFKVQLSAPSGRAVTVRYATNPGTATAGADYENASFTATIPAGQTSVNVLVFVVRDGIYEADETFFLDLSEPINATIADARSQCTITNDDPVPSLIANAALQAEGDSGQSSMTFTLRLSNASYQTVSVGYATADGTAVAPADYAAASGTVTFAPGETAQTFTVMVNGDTLDEINETFVVNFSAPVNVTLPANTQATGFINDDDGPAFSVSDVAVTEGDGGTTDAAFTVSLSAPSVQTVRVSFSTANGTAVSGEDYEGRTNNSINIPAGTTSGTIVVRVNGDASVEPDETFTVNLFSPVGGTVADAQGVGTILDDDEAHVHLSSQSYAANEGDGKVLITVTRSGNTAGEVAVDYATAPGSASDRSDYTTAVGTIRFAAGETQKTVPVLLTDDALAEGAEALSFTLSNAAGGKLRAPLGASVLITDNDAASGPSPVRGDAFNAGFFVRQHYLDFFNREPDQPGLAFWSNQLTSCGADAGCLDNKKQNVSAAFFLSVEFQQTGYLVYKTFGAAFGTRRVGNAVPLTLQEFLPDTQRIGSEVVVNQGDWQEKLEANKVAYFGEFVSRQQFLTLYPNSMGAAQYVDALNQNTGGTLSQAQRDELVNKLMAGQLNRAQALRAVAENAAFDTAEKNRAFVLMQYFGYLRRNPNDAPELNLDFGGYNFWLGKLNNHNGNFISAEMVRSFLVSSEYQGRFGQ